MARLPAKPTDGQPLSHARAGLERAWEKLDADRLLEDTYRFVSVAPPGWSTPACPPPFSERLPNAGGRWKR